MKSLHKLILVLALLGAGVYLSTVNKDELAEGAIVSAVCIMYFVDPIDKPKE